MAKRCRYVFLCMNERQPGNPKGSCVQGGAEGVRRRFSELLIAGNLKDTYRVVRVSCLDNCSRGPTLAIYPDDIWYQGVRPEDVEEIVESHLKNGRPVERLVLPPGEFD